MTVPARPWVFALGGNAISPPHGDLSAASERAALETAAREMVAVTPPATPLLVVHGNGPQAGRLLRAQPSLGAGALDIVVGQTQGELGYLIVEALERAGASRPGVVLVTRTLVDDADPAFAAPNKPIGAVLEQAPADGPSVRMADGRGWRRVVASPRPRAVLETEAIRALLPAWHVVAGGGGGIPVAGEGAARSGRAAVIDKDRIAALLAVALEAERLIFVTNVPHAFLDFGRAGARPIAAMRAAEARAQLARGAFAAGSMGPKVEAAADYAAATGRAAIIAALGSVGAALAGTAGTHILP